MVDWTTLPTHAAICTPNKQTNTHQQGDGGGGGFMQEDVFSLTLASDSKIWSSYSSFLRFAAGDPCESVDVDEDEEARD
jgi:hypothetical protein